MKEGLFDEAYKMFENAIELFPSDKRNYVNIGVIYLKKGEPENATEWMEKALEIDPDYVRGYYNLGTIYLNLGKDKKAISTFEKALEIEPEGRDSADIQTNLNVAKERFETSETEILSYLKNEKIEINNENILVLSNSVVEEKINSIDFIISKSGKMKIIAYSENGNFEITENKGKVGIKEI